jgi:hypothetical protein
MIVSRPVSVPKIIVVVLNWNGRQDTLDCLESLKGVDYPNWNVLVVDNGSEDGSVEAIRNGHPGISIIEIERNLGFAGGNNRGIQEALRRDAEFVLVLNNDTIVASDLLEKLARSASEHPGAAALGATIYYLADPTRLWYAGARWRRDKAEFEHIGQDNVESGMELAQVRETEYVCGCAMFLRASALRRVGLFDPTFFLLFEETDWCFRARQSGYRCLVVPDAKVWHKVSRSFGGRDSPLYEYFYIRNSLLWAKRYLGREDRLRVWYRTFMGAAEPWSDLAETIVGLVRGNGGLRHVYRDARRCLRRESAGEAAQERERIRARRAGLRDYLLGRFGDCPPEVRSPR